MISVKSGGVRRALYSSFSELVCTDVQDHDAVGSEISFNPKCGRELVIIGHRPCTGLDHKCVPCSYFIFLLQIESPFGARGRELAV